MTDTSGLPSRPRIPGYFHVVPMRNGQTQLRSAHRTAIISGGSASAVAKLIALLDGTRDIEQVLACFPDIPGQEVIGTIRALHEKRLLEDAPPPRARESTAHEAGLPADVNYRGATRTFFSIVFGDGRIAQDILSRSRVVVIGLGRVGSRAAELLARSGVGRITVVDGDVVDATLSECGAMYRPVDAGRTRSEVVFERLLEGGAIDCESAVVDTRDTDQVAGCIGGADLVLVCQDNPAVSIYRTVNAASLREGVRWLRAALEGFEAHLGPCVLPRATACYTCYEYRARGNWPHYEEDLAFEEHLGSGKATADYGCLPPVASLLAGAAVTECLKLLTGFSYPSTTGRDWVFNVNTFEAQAHPVLKLPRCPSCGFTAENPLQAQWAL